MDIYSYHKLRWSFLPDVLQTFKPLAKWLKQTSFIITIIIIAEL